MVSLGLPWTRLVSLILQLGAPCSTLSQLVSLGFSWLHLDSFGFTWFRWVSLGLARSHLDSLGFTWSHLSRLVSLGLTCLHLTWSHLVSLGLTRTQLVSFGLTWTHLYHFVSIGLTMSRLDTLRRKQKSLKTPTHTTTLVEQPLKPQDCLSKIIFL